MKLTIRDLINAGMFSILILIVTFLAGMIGFLPFMMPFICFSCGLFSALVFMLYATKIRGFGMILIVGILEGLLFVSSGHGIYAILSFVIGALLAEMVYKAFGYQNKKSARLAWTVYALGYSGNLVPLYFARETYAQSLIEGGYGQEFVEQLLFYMPTWSLLPVVLLGCVGSYVGATIGMKLLKKHFEKAGIAS